MCAAALGREDVHLPRIVAQLDSGCGNALALGHELLDEPAQVLRIGEVEVVGETRSAPRPRSRLR